MYTANGDLINNFLNFLGAISWPVIVLIVIFIFKNQIAYLILHIKKGNLFGFQFEIGDEIPVYSDDDKKIYSIRLQKPIEAKLGIIAQSIPNKKIEESKQKAEERLEIDTKQVGFKRGKLFQHENGLWGIMWNFEAFYGNRN